MSALQVASVAPLRLVELLRSSLVLWDRGQVCELRDRDVAVQAVELARSLGVLRPLLASQVWDACPQALMQIACPDEDTCDRECRLSGVWFARDVLSWVPAPHRKACEGAISISERVALGELGLDHLFNDKSPVLQEVKLLAEGLDRIAHKLEYKDAATSNAACAAFAAYNVTDLDPSDAIEGAASAASIDQWHANRQQAYIIDRAIALLGSQS